MFLTGIMPIGIKEMSGLAVHSLTFKQDMANAVGLTDEDVNAMLDHVHTIAPFQNEERERAFQKLKRHFNNLHFPGGCGLYHTALVNAMMNMLLDNDEERETFFRTDSVPEGLGHEPLPSSVYALLQNAPNLRNAAKSLAEGLGRLLWRLVISHSPQQSVK